MPKIADKQLNHIATRPKEYVDALKAGEQLAAAGVPIVELLGRISRDRLKLASEHSREAAALLKEKRYRSAVSRAYYAQYHAMRAVVYFMTPGDDFEAHSEMPKHVPGDFPGESGWKASLKNARLDRNRADYDPYPFSSATFEPIAKAMVKDSATLVAAARKYLRSKGCKI